MKKQKKGYGELQVVFSIIISLLLLPITLILIIFRQKHASELLRPLIILKAFLMQSRAVFTLFLINIILYIIVIIAGEPMIMHFIMFPGDFLSIRFYTIITSGFMHASLGHLIGNMVALLLIGRIVEKSFGSLKTIIIYFMSMIIAALASSIMLIARGVDAGSVGASGAVMGLVGIAIIYRPFEITFLSIIPLPVFLIGWLYIMSDIIGLTNTGSTINHIAHIAGMIGAIGIVAMIMPEEREYIRKGIRTNVALMMAVGALIALYYYIT
jgi:membrane associated rhomboid family serine protease